MALNGLGLSWRRLAQACGGAGADQPATRARQLLKEPKTWTACRQFQSNRNSQIIVKNLLDKDREYLETTTRLIERQRGNANQSTMTSNTAQ